MSTPCRIEYWNRVHQLQKRVQGGCIFLFRSFKALFTIFAEKQDNQDSLEKGFSPSLPPTHLIHYASHGVIISQVHPKIVTGCAWKNLPAKINKINKIKPLSEKPMSLVIFLPWEVIVPRVRVTLLFSPHTEAWHKGPCYSHSTFNVFTSLGQPIICWLYILVLQNRPGNNELTLHPTNNGMNW